MAEQHVKACQWPQGIIWYCKISMVGSRTFSIPSAKGLEHLCHTCIWGVFTTLYVEPFQARQYFFGCRGFRLMMDTPIMGEQEFCMPFPFLVGLNSISQSSSH